MYYTIYVCMFVCLRVASTKLKNIRKRNISRKYSVKMANRHGASILFPTRYRKLSVNGKLVIL